MKVQFLTFLIIFLFGFILNANEFVTCEEEISIGNFESFVKESIQAPFNGDACNKTLNTEVPIMNQEDTLLCGVYSSAQALSSQTKEPVSPIWLSLNASNTGSIKPSEVFDSLADNKSLCLYKPKEQPSANDINKFRQSIEGLSLKIANSTQVLKGLNKKNRLSKRMAKFSGIDHGTSTLKQVKESYKQKVISNHLKPAIKSFKKVFKNLKKEHQYSEETIKLKMSSLMSNLNKIKNESKIPMIAETLLFGLKKHCDENSIAKPKIIRRMIEYKRPEVCESSIDSSLRAGIPPIVGINFNVLEKMSTFSKGAAHYINVIGKECQENGREFYILRNSYGQSCKGHSKSKGNTGWACDSTKAQIKIPVEIICQNTTQYFIPN